MQANISVDEDVIERAKTALGGFGKEELIVKAARSAASRAANYLKSQSAARIGEVYDIKKSNLRLGENIKINFSEQSGKTTAEVWFSKKQIPLYRFNGTTPKKPSIDENKTVAALTLGGWRSVHPGTAPRAHAKVSEPLTTFEHSFVAQFKSGHVGIFSRRAKHSGGADRIREITGPSVKQMVGNDDVAEKLASDAAAKFQERMMHEIDYRMTKEFNRLAGIK